MRASTVAVAGAPGRRSRGRGGIRLSMYTSPPDAELSLDEFETFAIDRLIVLRGIESAKIRHASRREEDEAIRGYLTKHLEWRPDFYEEDSRKDQVSHFVLRLAHCQTEDQRRWFLAQECALFKHRLGALSGEEVAAFTKANGLDFELVSAAEKAAKTTELLTVGLPSAPPGTAGIVGFADMPFYKIPFGQALDLVARRQVYLEGGMAYVPGGDLAAIIVSRFRMSLSKQLLAAKATFPAASADPRLAPLLHGVHKQYVGATEFNNAAAKNKGGLTPENLDVAAKKNMPLCMARLHSTLKKDHKLKHDGRQQYWLFLKGAGLSMEDSIRFFQAEFSKVMTVETFNKEHLYNIRHAYGKEGKRTDYSPYSCMKIIMGSPPGPGHAHGCPYRHMDEANISAMLGTLSLNGAPRDGVLKEVRKGAFQVACQRHFEATHPEAYSKGINVDGVGNHPNAWIAASMDYHGHDTKAKAPPAGVTSSSSSSSSSSSGNAAERTDAAAAAPQPSISSAAMVTGE